MSKKNFRSGIDNLISDNIQNIENVVKINGHEEQHENENADERINWLITKIERLSAELKLWRTGELSVMKFQASLKKFNLKFNPDTNSFEKID